MPKRRPRRTSGARGSPALPYAPSRRAAHPWTTARRTAPQVRPRPPPGWCSARHRGGWARPAAAGSRRSRGRRAARRRRRDRRRRARRSPNSPTPGHRDLVGGRLAAELVDHGLRKLDALDADPAAGQRDRYPPGSDGELQHPTLPGETAEEVDGQVQHLNAEHRRGRVVIPGGGVSVPEIT